MRVRVKECDVEVIRACSCTPVMCFHEPERPRSQFQPQHFCIDFRPSGAELATPTAKKNGIMCLRGEVRIGLFVPFSTHIFHDACTTSYQQSELRLFTHAAGLERPRFSAVTAVIVGGGQLGVAPRAQRATHAHARGGSAAAAAVRCPRRAPCYSLLQLSPLTLCCTSVLSPCAGRLMRRRSSAARARGRRAPRRPPMSPRRRSAGSPHCSRTFVRPSTASGRRVRRRRSCRRC